MIVARNARAEATAVLPAGHEARVLEPSPPAVGTPTFADDPVDPGGASGIVVSPIAGHGVPWARIAATDPDVADFARLRWLGPYPTLVSLPDTFASTRDGLARLSVHAVYRMRRRANGKYGLRWTLGGFGTPFFSGADGDEQVRVEGSSLVHQRGDSVRSAPISSLRDAGAFLGIEVDPEFDHGFRDVTPAGDLDAPLTVDPLASAALGDWFGLAWSVLEAVRAERDGDPTRVQLWPEHFDAALDLAWGGGDDQRANIGFSPGDGFHPAPYLYVGPWTDDRPGGEDVWNAPFGAVIGYDDLAAGGGDGGVARDRALAFIADRLDRLAASDGGSRS